MRRRCLPVGALLATLVTQTAPAIGQQEEQLLPPGPLMVVRNKPQYAIALGPGTLHREAAVDSDELDQIEAGDVFDYLGETEDTFGRTWYMLGAGDAWRREQTWVAVAGDPEDVAGRTEDIAVLLGLPAPQMPPPTTASNAAALAAFRASERLPISVPAGWWRRTRNVKASTLGEFADAFGVPSWRVPEGVANELVELLADRPATLAEAAAYGQLSVSPRTGLIYRWEDGWTLTDDPLVSVPVISLLGNPQLGPDLEMPPEATGQPRACWRLIGGLDPRGSVVGGLDPAPPAPTLLSSTERPPADRYLGFYSLNARALPVAPPAAAAPRQLNPSKPPVGVQLWDASRRQAAYLEQTLAPALTARLRGRSLRLRVLARAPVAVDGGSTATVALEISSGNTRVSTSAPVGPLPTPISLEFVVPADATELTVRLLPADLSIAVLEGGRAIFDSVALTPSEWPEVLPTAPLLVHRVRAVAYRPAPRYTRAPVVVTERPPEEFTRVWTTLDHDGLPPGWLKMILAGEVTVNMSQDEVEAAWGTPSTVEEGTLVRWGWADRSVSFDREGKLLAWSRVPEPELEAESICGFAQSTEETP